MRLFGYPPNVRSHRASDNLLFAGGAVGRATASAVSVAWFAYLEDLPSDENYKTVGLFRRGLNTDVHSFLNRLKAQAAMRKNILDGGGYRRFGIRY